MKWSVSEMANRPINKVTCNLQSTFWNQWNLWSLQLHTKNWNSVSFCFRHLPVKRPWGLSDLCLFFFFFARNQWNFTKACHAELTYTNHGKLISSILTFCFKHPDKDGKTVVLWWNVLPFLELHQSQKIFWDWWSPSLGGRNVSRQNNRFSIFVWMY